MNRFYRLIWSTARACWVPASELARARGKRGHSRRGLLLVPFLLGAVAVQANPSGGQVIAGKAAIKGTPGRVIVQQSTPKAIIDWRRFSIGRNEVTHFVQPSSDAVTLNRVTGDTVSRIRGRLSANGNLFLVNPSGVVFGRDARIDVNGLVVSTHDIGNADFMVGNYAFTRPGKPDAEILNRGDITVAEAGVAAFVAPTVRNDGLIQAHLGRVTLAGAEGFTLDLYGDQLVEIAVDPTDLEAYATDGAPLIRVENGGRIEAQAVVLTARGVRKAVDGIINNDGIVRATSASLQGGKIVLGGGSETITVAGQLDASAADDAVDASGGEVLVRGETVKVGSTAVLKADAATGGGDGGFIDTSGRQIDIAPGAKVSAAATRGEGGAWLIDPTDITVSATSCSGTNCASAQAITASLDTGTSVTLTTDAGGTGDGDITINADINKTGGGDATLSFNSHDDVALNADIISTSGKLDLVFNVDLDNSGAGLLRLGNTTLDPNGGQLTVSNGKAAKSGGTSVIMADLTLSDFTWTGGVMAGDGTLNTTSTSTISGTSYGVLQDKVWNNSGTLDFADRAWLYFRNYTPSNSAPDILPTLNNLVGGTVNMGSTAARPIYGGSSASGVETFNNAGVLNWNAHYAPWGYSRLERVDLNNSGTVNVANGANLHLVNSHGNDTGIYNISAAQLINHNGGTRTLENGASVQGNGTFSVGNGTFTAQTGSMMASMLDLAVSGGTFNSEIDLTPKGLSVSGGTFVANGDVTTSSLALTRGTLTGSGTLNTTGTTTLSGNSYTTLKDKVWNNAGTINLVDSAYLYFLDTKPSDSSPDILPTLNNLAGGTVNMDSTDAHPFYGSTSSNYQEVFNNAGALNWNTLYSSWGHSLIRGVDFNNSGTVDIANGANIQLYYSNGSDSGTYTIAAGQYLEQYGGTRSVQTVAKLNGGGTLRVRTGDFTAQAGSMIAPVFNLAVSGGTFTSEIDLTPASLSVSGGTFVANGDVTTSSLALTRGTLTGSGTLNTTGTTTLSGNSYTTLKDKVWNNAGTINLVDSAYFYFLDTKPSDSSPDILPTLNNLAGGTVNMDSSHGHPIYGSTSSNYQEVFNNAGTLNWNTLYSSWGNSLIRGVDFNNTGTVNIANVANLRLYYSNGNDNGSYNIAAGQYLEQYAGIRSVQTGAKLNGSGSIRVGAGEFTAQAGSTIASAFDLVVSGGTFTSEIDLTPTSLSVSGGTFVANGDVTTSSLALTRGTLTGSGTLNTPGSTTFSGSSYVTLQDKVWNNSGTVTIKDSARLYLRNTTPNDSSPDILPTFNNLAGGTVNVNSTAPRPLDGYYYTNNVEIFNNAGTLNWNGVYSPWGYSVIDGIDFNNSGIFNIASGTNLEFYYSNGTDNGTYNIAAGQYLRHYGGTRTVQNGAKLNGSGTILVRSGEFTAEAGSVIAPTFDLELIGGVLTSGADLAPRSLTVSGGTLVNNGKLTTPDMAWSGGVVTGSGILNTTGTTTLSGNSYVTLRDTLWNNSGTLDLNDNVYLYFRDTTPSDASQDIQPTLNNLTGGTINVNSASGNPFLGYSYASNNNETLNNAGTLNWNNAYSLWGYSRIHGVDLNNSGTVNVNTGGNLQLYYSSGNHSGTFDVADKQSLDFYRGTHSFDDGSRFSGLGTIAQTATSMVLVGTSSGLTLAAGRTLDLNAFPLTGSGVLTNFGTVTGGQGISTGILENRGAANLGNITLAGLVNRGNLTLVEENSQPSTVTVLGSQATLASGKLDLGTGGTFVKDGGTLEWVGGSVVSSGSGGAVQLKNADIQFTGTGDRVLDAPGVEFNFVDFVMPGGSLTLDAGKLTFDLNNNVSSEIPAGSSLTINGGELVNNGPLDIYGNVLLNGGNYHAGGNLNIRGGSLAIANTFGAWSGPGVVSNYGQSSLTGSTDVNNPSVINSAYEVTGGLTVTGFVEFANTFSNSGTVDLTGTAEFQGQVDNTGTMNVAGPTTFTALVTNRGAINLNSGSATFSSGLNHVRGTTSVTGADLTGDVTVSGGTFNLANGQQVIGDMTLNGGVLKGNGGILTGKLTVTGGTLAPGASPGTLTLGSLDLKAGATTQLEIGGTTPGIDYDVINVLGTANLGGTLDVLHFQGFLPTPVTSFDGLIDAQTLTGTFATVNTPVGHRYDTIYGTASPGRFDLSYGRLLTITADDKSRVYGSNNPTWTASYSGLYAGDSAQSISGLTLTSTASAGSSVGTYAITPSGASAPGYYAIQYNPGTLTVSQRALTISADNKSRVYGNANPTFTATFSGLYAGDSAQSITGLTFNSTANASSAVGPYTITPGGASVPANYAVQYQAGTLAVSQRPITVTANNQSKTEGTQLSLPVTAFTVSNLASGDQVDSVTLTSATGKAADLAAAAGTYASEILASLATGTSFDPANYTITYIPGDLTVTASNTAPNPNPTPINPVPQVPQPSPMPGSVSQTGTPTAGTSTVSTSVSNSGPGALYTVVSANPGSNPSATVASTSTSTGTSNASVAAPASPTPTGSAGATLFTTRDTLPPAPQLSSGLALPQAHSVELLPAIDRVSRGGYTPEERTVFFSGLTESAVVSGFQAAGKDKLATFYANTANGAQTNAAQLVDVIRESGLSNEETTPQLAVYTRMRQIAMTKLLSEALKKLEQNPDLAEVFEDGVAGGEMQILLEGAVEVHAGIARIKGRIASESNKLYLGVNDQWVYVDPEGRFDASIPVPKGHSEMVLTAKDHGEGATRLTLPVFSDRDGRPPVSEGRRIALVIGVEAYDYAIPELDTPVNDARMFGNKLVSEQQFEVRRLFNPSKREILDTLSTLAGQLDEHDTLVVFYAGHGYQVEETGRGYWLPRDAETHDPRNWLSNRDIARVFHNTPARQILLVSDSCYSGAFTQGQNIGELDPKDVRRLRAVMALSSGGDQPVWDGGADGHSIFASKLLDSIRRDTIIGMPFYHQVRDKVVSASPQVPRYGAMIVPGRDNGADFVLLEPQI